MLTFAEIWERIVERPAAEFLVTPDMRLDYGGFAELLRRFSSTFDRSGLATGDRVLILTRNEPLAIAAFAAALLDGLVPVIMAPDSPTQRVASIASSVTARLAVLDDERCLEGWGSDLKLIKVPAKPAVKKGGWLLARGQMSEGVRLADLLELPQEGRNPRLPDAPDELAYLLFTSGTTQAPTGVKISRRNLLANVNTLRRLFGCDRQSRIFNDMVLAHADGMIQGPILALASGGAVIRSGGFSVPGLETWLNRVRQEHASHVITVPTVWSMIDRFAQHDDYFDAPECRCLMSVAARLDTALWSRLEGRFRRPLFNQYGLTETVASALYAGPHPEMGTAGTIGRPIDCAARLDPDATDHEGVGELQLRGDNVFPGYWHDDKRTRDTFAPDGWMRTGDLARILPDGSFAIAGRLKTAVMCGGFLIRPDEIDEVMAGHPAVGQAVTLAMPDDTFDEIAVTAIVLDGSATEAELAAYARERLEALKVPKHIVALAHIPRGISGKPNLEALRAEVAAALRADVIHAEPETGDLVKEVIDVAGSVFRVDPSILGLASTPDSVTGWDSFSQIALVFAVEERFGIRVPASRTAAIRSLADLIDAVRAGLR